MSRSLCISRCLKVTSFNFPTKVDVNVKQEEEEREEEAWNDKLTTCETRNFP